MDAELSEYDLRKRKRAEVRARLEAATGKRRRGFLTAERKRRLRALLRRNANEELKRRHELLATERRLIISQRTGQVPEFNKCGDDELRKLAASFHERISKLEDEKYDLEYAVAKNELDISQIAAKVNDMRGKFMKPTLKKVPRFGQKIEQMLINARKEVGFTCMSLKSIKKEANKQVDVEREKQKPEWTLRQRNLQLKQQQLQ